MSPEWLDLRGDEHVLLRATPSQNVLLASLIAGVVLMLAMAVVVGFLTGIQTGRRLSFIVLIFIVGLIAGSFLVTKRHEYVVTNQRLCSAEGITDKHVTHVPLTGVTDVTIQQSWWQQLFNVGSVRFDVVDSDEAASFGLVENPAEFQRQVLQVVDLGGDQRTH